MNSYVTKSHLFGAQRALHQEQQAMSERMLCTKEVTLGDEGVHVIVLLHEEWVGRSTWPIHHSKTNVSGRKKRTNTKCTLTEVESGSMITPM